MSHIDAERKRRRQMNEHLKVLRSLTPSVYIKRGDQASIIEGVIEFIKELQQVEESLEGKKRRKSNLSPSLLPRSVQLGEGSNNMKEVVACCKSPVADVQAKISGPNVILRTISRKILAQIGKIIYLLESLSFQILRLNISSMEDCVMYSFLIKIGLKCELSVEDLALEVQRSFPNEEFYVKEI